MKIDDINRLYNAAERKAKMAIEIDKGAIKETIINVE